MSIGFEDMHNLAQFDYKGCIANEQFFPDEFAVRISLYHLQQAVEKELNAIILFNGEYPAFKHDIGHLLNHCQKLGVEFSDEAYFIADSLTLWESKSRYDPYFNFEKDKYERAKNLFNEANIIIKEYIKNINDDDDDDDDDDEPDNNTLDLTQSSSRGR